MTYNERLLQLVGEAEVKAGIYLESTAANAAKRLAEWDKAEKHCADFRNAILAARRDLNEKLPRH
jgi:hypothetical protein